MNTTTDMIERELLEAARSGRDMDEIMRQYGRTKGPFYQALARATATLQKELLDLSSSFSKVQEDSEKLRREGESQRTQHTQIQSEMERAKHDLESQRQRLAEAQPLLNEAKQLQALGFNADQLRQLHQMLSRQGADQGVLPPEGIAQFFATVASYGEITSLELAKVQANTRVKQAKAEAKRWEAEARQREATAKARSSVISLAERLLDSGVTEADLKAWEEILAASRNKPEVLHKCLETFGTWEALFEERHQEVADLEAERERVTAEVAALTKERAGVTSAITAVRDRALKHMRRTSKQARESIDGLLAQLEAYRELQTEAASLQAEVRLARAFVGDDDELWTHVRPQSIERLLQCVLRWSLTTDYNPALAPPEPVRKGTLLQSYVKVPWRHLIWWAASGLMAETEKPVLKSG